MSGCTSKPTIQDNETSFMASPSPTKQAFLAIVN